MISATYCQQSPRVNRIAVYAARLTLSAMRRRIMPIFASLAGAALVALLLYGVSTQSANRTLDELVARRQYPPAPDATRALPVLGAGGRSTLAALRGKVVVLNFWASWCEPCQEEAPLLEHAQTQPRKARRDRARRHLPGRLARLRGFVRRYPPHLPGPA
jgi:thiol-disulfide isomerase/thioredoxin